MLLDVVPDTVVGTNCWVIAPAPGEECVIVDPGIDVLDRLQTLLREARLRPAAVILTHGHVDHVWSVTPVCQAHGVAALIHGDDVHRLADPLAHLDAPLLAMLQAQFGPRSTWTAPEDVLTLTDGQQLQLAGYDILVEHAPGHTEGSATFAIEAVPAEFADAGLTSMLLAGDVLFAGSIGRTDLPGGDAAAMERTLATVIAAMPDDRLVLPGHGQATTIARERASNPYLPR